jgi:hypothetical protein
MSEGDWSSLGGAQIGTRYRDCMGKTDRPSCAMNFQHFIIVYVRMEGYKCYTGTTPCRRRTHVRTNAKDKLRPFATNSAFCGGFKPWTVCYFPHHPTTRPHVTWFLMGVPFIMNIEVAPVSVMACAHSKHCNGVEQFDAMTIASSSLIDRSAAKRSKWLYSMGYD